MRSWLSFSILLFAAVVNGVAALADGAWYHTFVCGLTLGIAIRAALEAVVR